MKKWRALRAGDVIDLVAPGFACTHEELEGALRFLRSWGLVTRIPRDLFGKDVLCSHEDEVRALHLKAAFQADDSAAVWCLRGGYGSNRLLPLLEEMDVPERSKILIGLSDITSLHLFLNQSWGWSTFHGPLLDRLGKGITPVKYVRELKSLLFGDSHEIRFKNLRPLNESAQRRGKVSGKVVGGNLITLQSSIGTPWQWQTDGRILFFEDIGERGYRVDRVLTHMEQCGMFKKCKAVVFGDFTGDREPGKSITLVPKVLRRFAEEAKFPVFTGIQSGHAVIQRPLPFQTQSVLHTGQKGELVCDSGSRR